MAKVNKNVKQAPDLEEEDNLGFLIHETARAITLAYGTVMAPLGLTRPQVRVVAWVEHHPGITQTQLCEFIPISPMAMTGLLDRMASKDLIKRVDDPSDRRVKRIFLTDGALKLMPEMEQIATAFQQRALSGITAEGRETALKTLRAMRSNLQQIMDDRQ